MVEQVQIGVACRTIALTVLSTTRSLSLRIRSLQNESFPLFVLGPPSSSFSFVFFNSRPVFKSIRFPSTHVHIGAACHAPPAEQRPQGQLGCQESPEAQGKPALPGRGGKRMSSPATHFHSIPSPASIPLDPRPPFRVRARLPFNPLLSLVSRSVLNSLQ